VFHRRAGHGVFGLALFAGGVLPAALLKEELHASARGVTLLRWLLRWLAPALIAVAALAPFVLP
jgi:hypothetical protein